ncbi:hypothetical protein B0J11DRAFT_416854, partial [Dendryphion nanum]
MAAGISHIIPVSPANGGDPAVVVEVVPKGPHPLDIRLVGCEGENVYVTNIKHRNIADLKKNTFKGSDDEWETVLSYFLLQRQPETAGQAKILQDIRMVYSINGNELDISIRRDVQGIKIMLGNIILRYEEEEINPFEWAQTSAVAHSSALKEISRLKAELALRQDTVDKLNSQLEDFIKAKDEAETAMLQQFMELLNEKKRKIRDQSRLLASAKVDRSTALAIQVAREEKPKTRTPGPSRTSKRKAPAKAPIIDQESDVDQMEIDEVKEEEQNDDEDSGPGAATPDRTSVEETEDEDENQIPAQRPGSFLEQSSQRSAGTMETRADSSGAAVSAPAPPTRELPFVRRTTRSHPEKRQAPAPADEDDETDDD